jgi:hypothetical protein
VVEGEEAVAEPVLVVEGEEAVVEGEEEVVVMAAVRASVDRLVHRKAKRLRQHQRESLYPHLADDHCYD